MHEIDYILKELEFIDNMKIREKGDKVYRALNMSNLVYDFLNSKQQEIIDKIILEIYSYKRRIKKSYHSNSIILYMYRTLLKKYRDVLLKLMVIGIGKILDKDYISNVGMNVLLEEIKDL